MAQAATKTAPAATPATVVVNPNAAIAATLAAQAHNVLTMGTAPLTAASIARKYTKGLAPAFAARTFTLTPAGHALIANNGLNAHGRLTAIGATCLALGIASNGGNSATGAAIVTAMLTSPACLAAFLGTKANGVHFTASNPPTPGFAAGYVKGLAMAKHGLAK